jgi:hypothetical protein
MNAGTVSHARQAFASIIGSHVGTIPVWVGDGASAVVVDMMGVVVLAAEVVVMLVVGSSHSTQYSFPATTPIEHPDPTEGL